ncbi:hypothetical protein SEUCBS139899_005924 [Sporothrix eucalyptigena]|uniref:Uncharacterized protein n=1 Tax=Sporothrix eucalyptigena TaxID=1812306 RepID=A0ABP0AXD2_9PEZI
MTDDSYSSRVSKSNADESIPCDATRSYATFDDLAKYATDGIGSSCTNFYVLSVLGIMLNNSYTRYNDANNG